MWKLSGVVNEKPGGMVVIVGQWILNWVGDCGEGVGTYVSEEELMAVGVKVMVLVKDEIDSADKYVERFG